jgi:hypothetical protein
VRTYHESSGKSTYIVRSKVNYQPDFIPHRLRNL